MMNCQKGNDKLVQSTLLAKHRPITRPKDLSGSSQFIIFQNCVHLLYIVYSCTSISTEDI